MILHKNKGVRTRNCSSLETDSYIFYWQGLLFIKGFLSGAESVKELDRLITTCGLEQAVGHLCGQFVCFACAKRGNQSYAFADNSGLGYLAYTGNAVSSSFLELIGTTDKRDLDFSLQKAVELILTGFVYRYETVFDTIKLLKPDEIISFPSMVRRKKAAVEYQIGSPKEAFRSFFGDIPGSLRNHKVSVDNTGGTDSRTILVLLHQAGLPLETACAIPGPGGLELNSIQKSVDLLKLEFHPTYQEIDRQTILSELGEVFEYCDGLFDIVSCHRLWQLDVARRKRGVTLTVGGSGGELYKDALWWRTALLSKDTNSFIGKMAASGKANWTEGLNFPGFFFSEEAQAFAKGHKDRTYQYLLSEYGDIDKFQAAHSMFHDYTMVPPRPKQGGIASYSVLLENELTRIAARISNREKPIHLFYRKLITPANRSIARLHVDRILGMSMSNEPLHVLRDSSQYVTWPVYNLFKKRKPSRNRIYDYVRKLRRTEENLELLKDRGVIDQEVAVEDVPDSYLGRCYTLAELLRVAAAGS